MLVVVLKLMLHGVARGVFRLIRWESRLQQFLDRLSELYPGQQAPFLVGRGVPSWRAGYALGSGGDDAELFPYVLFEIRQIVRVRLFRDVCEGDENVVHVAICSTPRFHASH